MKKSTLLTILFVLPILMIGQTSIPNGGFESWSSTTYSYPDNYIFNVNNEDKAVRSVIFGVTQTTGYNSAYGVQVKTTAEIGMGYFLNFQPSSEDPTAWHGGIPYTQQPTGITGYFKYNVASGDAGIVIVAFSKNGSNIGTYYAVLSGLHADYTAFDVNFSPALTQTPDSVVIGVASSWPNPVVGSTLAIDKIEFKGVAAQPALMNGDFEVWHDVSVDKADSWYNQNGRGVSKTTDFHKGQYAIELKTFLGEQNNVPAAQPAQIITGYYPKDCNGNCYPLGGYPFTQQSDVLEFYYKYIPTNETKANIGLYFKKKGSGMDGWYAGTDLAASSQYQYMEIPINLSFVPDSVIIQINSSQWENSALSYVGTDLKIDDLCFRSQKNSSSNVFNPKAGTLVSQLFIYPNPTENSLFINANLSVNKVVINDLRGVEMLSIIGRYSSIDVSSLQKGVYIIQLQTNDGNYKQKFIKN